MGPWVRNVSLFIEARQRLSSYILLISELSTPDVASTLFIGLFVSLW